MSRDWLGEQKADRIGKSKTIELFIRNLERSEQVITEFDESLWRRTVERIIVKRESDITVEFKDGRQVKVSVLGV